MSTFVAEILAFPTVIFTILLAVALLYWLLSMLGMVDLDGLDGVDGAADALDGGAEALDGAAEALDGAAEAVDGAADALDAKAAAVDGASAAVDAKAELLDANRRKNARAKKGRVPITITASLFAFFGWMISFLLIHNLADNPTDAGLVMSLAAGGAAAVGGWLLAKLAGAPIAKVMVDDVGITSRELVGRELEVTTGKVDQSFGQGRIEDGGASLVVNIRCEPGRLKRGDKAMVIDYDPSDGVYTVEPLDDLLNRSEMTT